MPKVRIIGIDPGLRNTGWGVIEAEGMRLSYVADGSVHSAADAPLATRLLQIHSQLAEILQRFAPDEAAVEETFVNKDARATLKLGQARGSLETGEAGEEDGIGAVGKLDHSQMLTDPEEAAQFVKATQLDALAIAICHAHHRGAQTLAKILARS